MDTPDRSSAGLRIRFAGLTAAVIGAGLLTREISGAPPFIGEALHAVTMVFLLRVFAPRAGRTRLVCVALAICWIIEFSQLLHAPGLDEFRSGALGGLLLGQGFSWGDLGAYAGGAAFAYALEILLFDKSETSAGETASDDGTNFVTGKIIRCGACEFLAETPLGEIRGRLADCGDEPAEGETVRIAIPPGALRLDTFAPDENAFAGKITECVTVAGVTVVRFLASGGLTLTIRADSPPPEIEGDERLVAWVLPEDVRQVR